MIAMPSIFDPDPVKRRAGLIRGEQRALEGMATREKVREFVRSRFPAAVGVKEVAAAIGVTDPCAHNHLKVLVVDREVTRSGVKYVACGEGRSE